jgi:hypothetical protein
MWIGVKDEAPNYVRVIVITGSAAGTLPIMIMAVMPRLILGLVR